ncbi:MAG: hypothetical protein U1E63_11670 [Burkholderiales bacterium]|mgnify:CR=1 FL=1|jgi:hypothetical protein
MSKHRYRQRIFGALALFSLLGLAPAAASARCAFAGQPVATVLKKKVAVFQADGKWLKDVDAATIAPGATVRDCNEELGLVKVVVEGREQWVDRLALNIRPAKGPECIARAASRESDVTAPVSSGVNESCVPAAK